MGAKLIGHQDFLAELPSVFTLVGFVKPFGVPAIIHVRYMKANAFPAITLIRKLNIGRKYYLYF